MVKKKLLGHESLESRQLLASVCNSYGFSSTTGTPTNIGLNSIVCTGTIENMTVDPVQLTTAILPSSSLQIAPTKGATSITAIISTLTTGPDIMDVTGSIDCTISIVQSIPAQVPVGHGYTPTASLFGIIPSAVTVQNSASVTGVDMLASNTTLSGADAQVVVTAFASSFTDTVCVDPFKSVNGVNNTTFSAIQFSTQTPLKLTAIGSFSISSGYLPNGNIVAGLSNFNLATGPNGLTAFEYVYSY